MPGKLVEMKLSILALSVELCQASGGGRRKLSAELC